MGSVVVGLDRMAPPDPELGPTVVSRRAAQLRREPLALCDDRAALVFWNERGRQRELSYRELNQQVARWRRPCAGEGVAAGDRVAGFMPNLPETVIAMLAAASLGAIWSSCSPDFGANGVLDRFGQIQPEVLFCADGYRYAGKQIDRSPGCAKSASAFPRSSASSLCPIGMTKPEIGTVRDAARGLTDPVAPDRPSARFARCPSITRSTSCTPPEPLVFPSAWCTEPAGRCCST